MRVLTVVPVKGLSVSKKRLANVLTLGERIELSVSMLKDVLDVLKASSTQDVLVVSVDAAVGKIAGEYDFSVLAPKDSALNASLREAVEFSVREKFDAVLVLPADVPFVSPHDIDRLFELGCERSTVVLSGSKDGGTNALFLHPAGVIPICFGEDSFFSHVEEALKRDLKLRFYFSRGLMLDIDSEADLKKVAEMEGVESKQVSKSLKALRKAVG